MAETTFASSCYPRKSRSGPLRGVARAQRDCSSTGRALLSLPFSTHSLFAALVPVPSHARFWPLLLGPGRDSLAPLSLSPPAPRTSDDEDAAPVLARARRPVQCDRARAGCDCRSVQAAAQVGTRPVRVSRSHRWTRSGRLSHRLAGKEESLVHLSFPATDVNSHWRSYNDCGKHGDSPSAKCQTRASSIPSADLGTCQRRPLKADGYPGMLWYPPRTVWINSVNDFCRKSLLFPPTLRPSPRRSERTPFELTFSSSLSSMTSLANSVRPAQE